MKRHADNNTLECTKCAYPLQPTDTAWFCPECGEHFAADDKRFDKFRFRIARWQIIFLIVLCIAPISTGITLAKLFQIDGDDHIMLFAVPYLLVLTTSPVLTIPYIIHQINVMATKYKSQNRLALYRGIARFTLITTALIIGPPLFVMLLYGMAVGIGFEIFGGP